MLKGATATTGSISPVDQAVRIRYVTDLFRLKYYNTIYTTINGSYESLNKAMLMPDTIFINNKKVELIIRDDNDKSRSNWRTNNSSDNEHLSVKTVKGLPIDMHRFFSQQSLPWELKSLLKQHFIFTTGSKEKIDGTIAAIHLLKEVKSETLIRLTPTNNFIYTKGRKWLEIQFLELRGSKWWAVNNGTVLDQGDLQLL